LQPQRRHEHGVRLFTRHRARGHDVHGAFHARIEREIAAGELADDFHDGLDVDADEVERDLLFGDGGGSEQERARDAGGEHLLFETERA